MDSSISQIVKSSLSVSKSIWQRKDGSRWMNDRGFIEPYQKFGRIPKHTPDDPDFPEKEVGGGVIESNFSQIIDGGKLHLEIREIIDAYNGSPDWMKDPDGNPSNLDELSWTIVKTSSFKKWFGDWEELTRQKKYLGIIDKALKEKNWHQEIIIKSGYNGDPSGKLSHAFGRKIDTLSLNTSDIVHAIKIHGEGNESNPNQIPISKIDFIKAIKILENPDEYGRFNHGKSVVFSKKFTDGTIVCVETSTRHKNRINLKTLWKVAPGRTPHERIKMKPFPLPTSETAPTNRTTNPIKHSDELIVNPNFVSKIIDSNGEPMLVDGKSIIGQNIEGKTFLNIINPYKSFVRGHATKDHLQAMSQNEKILNEHDGIIVAGMNGVFIFPKSEKQIFKIGKSGKDLFYTEPEPSKSPELHVQNPALKGDSSSVNDISKSYLVKKDNLSIFKNPRNSSTKGSITMNQSVIRKSQIAQSVSETRRKIRFEESLINIFKARPVKYKYRVRTGNPKRPYLYFYNDKDYHKYLKTVQATNKAKKDTKNLTPHTPTPVPSVPTSQGIKRDEDIKSQAPTFQLEQETVQPSGKKGISSEPNLFGITERTERKFLNQNFQPKFNPSREIMSVGDLVTEVKSALLKEGMEAKAKEWIDATYNTKSTLSSVMNLAYKFVIIDSKLANELRKQIIKTSVKDTKQELIDPNSRKQTLEEHGKDPETPVPRKNDIDKKELESTSIKEVGEVARSLGMEQIQNENLKFPEYSLSRDFGDLGIGEVKIELDQKDFSKTGKVKYKLSFKIPEISNLGNINEGYSAVWHDDAKEAIQDLKDKVSGLNQMADFLYEERAKDTSRLSQAMMGNQNAKGKHNVDPGLGGAGNPPIDPPKSGSGGGDGGDGGEPQPIGQGDHGPIYNLTQFPNLRAGIDFLIRKQDGEIRGALSHPEIKEPIDLIWGKPGTGKSDGYGLSKLVKFHPEVLDDLQGIIQSLDIKTKSPNRIRLQSKFHEASVSLEWLGKDKTWLLTAYQKGSEPGDSTMNIAPNQNEGMTAPSSPQGLDSSGGEFSQEEFSSDWKDENYRFADQGYVAGARKESASSHIRRFAREKKRVRATDIDWTDMEQYPEEAQKLITKSNLFGEVNFIELIERGMERNAAYVLSKLYNLIPTSPSENSPEARIAFTEMLQAIRDRLEKNKSLNELLEEMKQIKQEFYGKMFTPEEEAENKRLRSELDKLIDQRIAVLNELEAISKEINNEKNTLWQLEKTYKIGFRTHSAFQKKHGRRKTVEDLEPEIQKMFEDVNGKIESLNAKKENFQKEKEYELSEDIRKEVSDDRFVRRYVYERTGIKKEIETVSDQIKAIESIGTKRYQETPQFKNLLSLGEGFIKSIHYGKFERSAFSRAVVEAMSNVIPESFANPNIEKVERDRKVTQEGISLQLKVAEKIERVGGRKISVSSTKEFKDKFKLANVQSGNWVLKDPVSASFHIQKSSEAFLDLADVLKISDSDVSLNGELSLAFGARGQGGKNSAVAHYESARRIINITKMKGGGSLAHEWLHAIDHITNATLFDPNERQAGDFMTTGASQKVKNEKYRSVVEKWKELSEALVTGDSSLYATMEYGAFDSSHVAYNLRRKFSSYKSTRTYKDMTAQEMIDKLKSDYRYEDLIKERINLNSLRVSGAEKKRIESKKRAITKDINRMNKWVELVLAYDANRETIDNAEANKSSVKLLPGKGRYQTQAGVSSFYAEARAIDEQTAGVNIYWAQKEELAARAFQAFVEDKLQSMGRKNDYLSSMADNIYYTMEGTKPFPEGKERERFNRIFEEVFTEMRKSGLLNEIKDIAKSFFAHFQNRKRESIRRKVLESVKKGREKVA